MSRLSLLRSSLLCAALCVILPAVVSAQATDKTDSSSSQPTTGQSAAPAPDAAPAIDKRIFGVLPNYRTADGTVPFMPITTKRKFYIAAKDSFDYPVYITAAAFAEPYQHHHRRHRHHHVGVVTR